jgi:hypothetical protein
MRSGGYAANLAPITFATNLGGMKHAKEVAEMIHPGPAYSQRE